MKKIDWHSGFVNAMKLELLANEDDLEYEEEHPVANRAQRIDLLIIKKVRDTKIVNEIGTIFDKYNILEYKSPEDSLTLGDFYKVLSYMGLYLEELHKYDEYGRDAFTMTFVRRRKPVKLFEYLRRDDHKIIHRSKGIYEVCDHLPFRTQIIVTKEWDREESDIHTWLRSLTDKCNGVELKGIISETPRLNEKHKEYAERVMNVFTTANNNYMKSVKEDGDYMCEAVNELFADWTQKEKVRADAEKKRADAAEAKLDKVSKALQEALDEVARLRAAAN